MCTKGNQAFSSLNREKKNERKKHESTYDLFQRSLVMSLKKIPRPWRLTHFILASCKNAHTNQKYILRLFAPTNLRDSFRLPLPTYQLVWLCFCIYCLFFVFLHFLTFISIFLVLFLPFALFDSFSHIFLVSQGILVSVSYYDKSKHDRLISALLLMCV